ncbi:hypothetical protein Pmani_026772 [Petrolisthes manimaculis]|uniref:Uncharacterized protein n=1 Tax=Petrolisthes manimaculis TaxID=1843537 RepID=A0AAE1P4I4_9EUCA|nr:hypothetical protein Pmani_026772 [Petrolisthes manimaculis]
MVWLQTLLRGSWTSSWLPSQTNQEFRDTPHHDKQPKPPTPYHPSSWSTYNTVKGGGDAIIEGGSTESPRPPAALSPLRQKKRFKINCEVETRPPYDDTNLTDDTHDGTACGCHEKVARV